MKLNPDNYYTEAANYEYMSVSQYKDFAGSYGRRGCESRAMANLRGEWSEAPSVAMMVGSYVDAYFESGTSFGTFQTSHPDMFRQDGGLRAPYERANEIIRRIERDDFMMQCLSGEKQVIMTGEVFGIPWKIKMDSYHPGKVIVDLKVVESIRKLKWVKDIGYLDFIRYWGYDVQGAIYQEIVYQNTGKKLPFYIAAATKEPVPEIQVIHVQDIFLRQAMTSVAYNINRVKEVKSGKEPPGRCEICGYCLDTRVLHCPVGLLDITSEV